MRQPSSATPATPAPTGAPAALAAPAATETVTRPDPGLARGKWEAPAYAFWVALAIIVVLTTLYVLGRMGILKRRKGGPAGRGPQA